jgi:hypothetical protein
MLIVIWASLREDRLLRRVEDDPRTSVQRFAVAGRIGVPLVCRTTHTTCSERKPSTLLTIVQGWCFPMARREMRCKLFIANILFTDEKRFTSDEIAHFLNTHVWMNDNPHITLASKHHD